VVILSHSKFYPLCDKGKLGSIVNRLRTGGPGDRGSMLGKGGVYVSINSLVSNDPSSENKAIWP
jgi:hypothetical protein